jgi:hypothetical protein
VRVSLLLRFEDHVAGSSLTQRCTESCFEMPYYLVDGCSPASKKNIFNVIVHSGRACIAALEGDGSVIKHHLTKSTIC